MLRVQPCVMCLHQAALLSAEVGFDGLFFGRIDYQACAYARAPRAHCVCTAYALHTHCVRTACAPHVHVQHSVYTTRTPRGAPRDMHVPCMCTTTRTSRCAPRPRPLSSSGARRPRSAPTRKSSRGSRASMAATMGRRADSIGTSTPAPHAESGLSGAPQHTAPPHPRRRRPSLRLALVALGGAPHA